MKVLIVHPFRGNIGALEADEFMPSLATLYLAAVLREAGHEPVLLDLATKVTLGQDDPQQYCLDRLAEAVEREQAPLVAISFLFSGMFPTAQKYAALVKQVAPDTKVITGGIHATTFPEEILSNCPEFDYIGIGEGETIIVEIANRVASGDLDDLGKLNGFAYRDEDGSVHVNKERTLEDYDALPMPAWDMIDFAHYEKPRPEFYSPNKSEIKNLVPIISSRGCPYRCTFCDLYLIQGRKLRRKSVMRFVDEVEYLNKERGQNYFAFQDDNLVRDRKNIIAICNEIVRRNLKIQFETASGLHIKSLNDEVIDSMVEAGMVYAAISVEHGNDYMRNEVIKKATDKDEIYAAVESLKRHKILIRGNWIMGYPEETLETLQDTYDMIEDLKIDRAAVLKLIPYPGTPVFDQAVRDNLFIEEMDTETLWRVPFEPHQNQFVIKPYKLSLDEMQEWWDKFLAIRNKYFGYRHQDLKPPRGFIRGADGLVYPGGDQKPENTNKDVAARMANVAV